MNTNKECGQNLTTKYLDGISLDTPDALIYIPTPTHDSPVETLPAQRIFGLLAARLLCDFWEWLT